MENDLLNIQTDITRISSLIAEIHTDATNYLDEQEFINARNRGKISFEKFNKYWNLKNNNLYFMEDCRNGKG